MEIRSHVIIMMSNKQFHKDIIDIPDCHHKN